MALKPPIEVMINFMRISMKAIGRFGGADPGKAAVIRDWHAPIGSIASRRPHH
jgi:hypothetical protein